MSHVCTIDHHCEWTSKWWKQMWEMEREQVKRLLVEKNGPFNCQAVIRHGPGHQSSTECERPDPHSLDGEHWANYDWFEWHGAEGYDR